MNTGLVFYSCNLNSKLLQYSDHGDLLARQMVPYSDAHGSLVFKSSFGKRTSVQTTI